MPRDIVRCVGTGVMGFVPALLFTSLAVSGCHSLLDDCWRYAACPPTPEESAGGNGGDGGTSAACTPSLAVGAVENACGVFVSAGGADAAAGTKAEPVRTLGKAIELAKKKGKPVYACAEVFKEAVEVPAGVELYGGLDCAREWVWVGETKQTTIEGPADMPVLRLVSGEGTTRIEDVLAKAANAKAMGASSIAVLAEAVAAELVRCELVAGDGAEGEVGTSPGGSGSIGAKGTDGGTGCMSPSTHIGGEPGLIDCSGEQSNGGYGGAGSSLAVAQDGLLGAPDYDGPGGEGGKGEDATACMDGQPGAMGAPGKAGEGATGMGSISSIGYSGNEGEPGKTAGEIGQGGGGGGGAKLGHCGPNAGPSGGGGGAGGCGGQPGGAGGPGGSSIGLISADAKLTLTDVSIYTANGGLGGTGGDGQPGGVGGVPGLAGGMGACAGGVGGAGGRGGSGGGGLGGHSIGIAYTGAAPKMDAVTEGSITVGSQGMGGLGGNGNEASNAGAAGVASPVQAF